MENEMLKFKLDDFTIPTLLMRMKKTVFPGHKIYLKTLWNIKFFIQAIWFVMKIQHL
jgi:hypothetical protein